MLIQETQAVIFHLIGIILALDYQIFMGLQGSDISSAGGPGSLTDREREERLDQGIEQEGSEFEWVLSHLRKESFDSTVSSGRSTNLVRPESLESVHLKLTWKQSTSSVVGSITDDEHPFAAHGTWLQVLIQDDGIDEMIDDLDELSILMRLAFYSFLRMFPLAKLVESYWGFEGTHWSSLA
ncbi:hypothetical protein Btru_027998 [Bulinus truncatus]|nr:hypothetical protein Btru_027998 [Bulinus truncatus]